jgi:hypothetical protein
MAASMLQKVIPFRCADKLLSESWDDPGKVDDLANFPSPFRMALIGPPGRGKSTTIKNIIIHQEPPFTEVYVIHQDAARTKEYDDLQPTAIIADIPDGGFWSGLAACHEEPGDDGEPVPVKRAVIVDDIEFAKATTMRLENLGVLMRYASTHRGLSVMFSHQDFFGIPPIVVKMSEVFVLWRPASRRQQTAIEDRVGLPKGELTGLFADAAKKPRDSITVDLTPGSPAPLRLNLWEPLETA